jgi:carbon storage regulator
MTMLVLSRKMGERILVPHCDLAITVVAIDGNTVRLGVSAPAQIGVYREELWQRLCPEGARKDPLAITQEGIRASG